LKKLVSLPRIKSVPRKVLHSGFGAAVCLIYAVTNCEVVKAAVIAKDSLETAVSAPADLIEQDDFFNVFAAEQYSYDDNVYRLAPNVTDLDTLNGIGPHPSKEDHINTVSAGLDGQWSKGRQTLLVDLSAGWNRFDINDNLNYTSEKGRAQWNWDVGGVLTGQVGATYASSLGSFVNATVYSRNIVDTTNYFGSARYQVGPHWAIFGGILDSGTTLENVASQGNDVHSKAVETGAEYTTSVKNTLGLGYRYTDAGYPPSSTTNDGFREDIEYFYIKHAFSDKTSIDGSAGYLKRDYTSASIGSFSGIIWTVSALWKPADKLNFSVDAWRRLQAYITAQTDYFVSKGGSIAPSWVASEKITVSLLWSLQDQDYVLLPGASESSTGARRDTLNMTQVNVAYTPARFLIFNFAYAYEKRDSNISSDAFNDRVLSAQATVKF
jgi:hypothetical protein